MYFAGNGFWCTENCGRDACSGSRYFRRDFYKRYPSKEMLLFELLEDMHTEIYEASAGVFEQNHAKSSADRSAGRSFLNEG